MSIGSQKLNDTLPFTGYILIVFSFILLTPGLLIQASIFGGGPCLSGNHIEFNLITFAFLVYCIVIWGIMKLVKKNKQPVIIENKQNNDAKKQSPSDTDMKGV
jgi:hypothetical protein